MQLAKQTVRAKKKYAKSEEQKKFVTFTEVFNLILFAGEKTEEEWTEGTVRGAALIVSKRQREVGV